MKTPCSKRHHFQYVLFLSQNRGRPTSSSNFEGDDHVEPSWGLPFFGENLFEQKMLFYQEQIGFHATTKKDLI